MPRSLFLSTVMSVCLLLSTINSALAISYGDKIAPTPGIYKLDPDYSSIKFEINTLGYKTVTGQFSKVYGGVKFDGKDLNSLVVHAVVIIESLSTGNGIRDKHLKKDEDFFNDNKYTRAYFDSTKVEVLGSNIFKLYGDLQIKNFRTPIVLNCRGLRSYKNGTGEAALSVDASTKLNRKDYNVIGGHFIKNALDVNLEVKAINTGDASKWTEECDSKQSEGKVTARPSAVQKSALATPQPKP